MDWIVLGEKNGKIMLTSKATTGEDGKLPKGSYLTIEQNKTKFILRVDESFQYNPYNPSPMIVDMDLSPLLQDQKCKNLVAAYRVADDSQRNDGLVDFIKPQIIARRSNQKEIDMAMGNIKNGPSVFLATIESNKNQILIDQDGKLITVKLPNDMFFHQTLVCGKTGSGKTVATKYLAQYFVEELKGAVLAINVKEADFLKMYEPSKTTNPDILKEWKTLNQDAHGVYNFTVYYPANSSISKTKGVDPKRCKKITLDVRKIEPESLTGLLQGLTELGAASLPNIFRYWQDERSKEKNDSNFKFSKFLEYFKNAELNAKKYSFIVLTERGDVSEYTLAKGTFDAILRKLEMARDFFDNEGADTLDEKNILKEENMSVIDTTGKNGIQFGSILLRDLLQRIMTAKSDQKSNVPILIIIDEVHKFWETGTSREALGILDRICREGRSQKIGVIFSSQNPEDIPTGLDTVINTKIFFKSDYKKTRELSPEEMESLKKGYAVVSIHELPQIKLAKFPLSFSGVFE